MVSARCPRMYLGILEQVFPVVMLRLTTAACFQIQERHKYTCKRHGLCIASLVCHGLAPAVEKLPFAVGLVGPG